MTLDDCKRFVEMVRLIEKLSNIHVAGVTNDAIECIEWLIKQLEERGG